MQAATAVEQTSPTHDVLAIAAALANEAREFGKKKRVKVNTSKATEDKEELPEEEDKEQVTKKDKDEKVIEEEEKLNVEVTETAGVKVTEKMTREKEELLVVEAAVEKEVIKEKSEEKEDVVEEAVEKEKAATKD